MLYYNYYIIGTLTVDISVSYYFGNMNQVARI